jgi:hypothetical protein
MNKRFLISLAPLLAMMAFAVMPALAQAAAPELGRCIKKAKAEGAGYSNVGCTATTGGLAKYEWAPGPGVKPSFTSKEGKSTIETVGKGKITCTSDTDAGQYTGATTDSEIIRFSGCKDGSLTCTSPGAVAGEIVTSVLASELGLIKPPNDAGVSLAALGGPFAEFECGGLVVVISGSVIANATPINKMTSTFKESFTSAHGLQKPESFDGQAKDTLTCAVYEGKGGPLLRSEQCGFTSADTVANEEKTEIRVLPELPKWWVGGKLLVGAQPIAEETNVTVPLKLEFALEGGKGPKFTIECLKEKVQNSFIEAPSSRSDEADIYEGCKVVGKEAECSIATITTEPLKANFEGAPGAEKLKFAPKAGSPLAAYEITGAGCTVKGFYEADGDMICNYSGVEAEEAEHPLEFTKTSGTEVTVRSGTAMLTVTDKVHLDSDELWSAF